MTSMFGRAHRIGGLNFCGCHLLPQLSAGPSGGGAPASAKAPVVLKGKKACVIDTHAHCFFQAGLDLMGAEAASILPPVKGVPEHFLQQADPLKSRLEAMDQMGVDMQVLKIGRAHV